jgi:hypothetical protein
MHVDRSAVDLREWGWGKHPSNEAARAVGRSRTVRAKQKSLQARERVQTVARQEPSVIGRSAPTNEDGQGRTVRAGAALAAERNGAAGAA